MLHIQPHLLGWESPVLFGQWAYINSEATDPVLKQKAVRVVVDSADEIIKTASSGGYGSTLKLNEYHWGSNRTMLSKAGVLLIAHQLNPKQEYMDTAADQIDIVLGRNALGYSFVTGEGIASVRYPHHRIVNSVRVLLPGFMVGGANGSGGDPVVDKIKAENPPAKSYTDNVASYASNEYAIDYNAQLAFVLTHVAARQ